MTFTDGMFIHEEFNCRLVIYEGLNKYVRDYMVIVPTKNGKHQVNGKAGSSFLKEENAFARIILKAIEQSIS